MLSRFVALPKQIFRMQCYLPGLMLTVASAVTGELTRLAVGKVQPRSCRRLGGDMGHQFLSTEWITSVMEVREEYAAFDAERIFSVPGVRVADPKACQCGEVLKGVIKPWECKVFGTACTPETPIGTCMVSSEGACAAYYNFGRFTRERVKEATRT